MPHVESKRQPADGRAGRTGVRNCAPARGGREPDDPALGLRHGMYAFSVLVAPVAQTCSLSVSPEIVAAREDFFNHGWTRINTDDGRLSLIRVHPCSSVVGTYWLRLRRAAQYRRFLTCHLPPASNVLPITN